MQMDGRTGVRESMCAAAALRRSVGLAGWLAGSLAVETRCRAFVWCNNLDGRLLHDVRSWRERPCLSGGWKLMPCCATTAWVTRTPKRVKATG
ncbi:hypothetical protein IWX49DRAFT_337743 [Phyllosticta citricarpa]